MSQREFDSYTEYLRSGKNVLAEDRPRRTSNGHSMDVSECTTERVQSSKPEFEPF